jgi:hypothetical protein
MIGTPPSARPMWHDPAAHAIDFSKRYAEPLDQYVTVRNFSGSGGASKLGLQSVVLTH